MTRIPLPILTSRRRAATALIAVGLLASSCVGASSDDLTDSTTPDSGLEGVSTTATNDEDGTVTTVVDSTTTSAPADDETDDLVPPVFWAIDALTLDLVLVDTGTGSVLRRTLGWGADLGAPEPEGGRQELVEVEPAGDVVWVADCCEPAAGNVFGSDVGSIEPVPSSGLAINGQDPAVSPDGSLLAAGILDIGVAVFDARTGEQLTDPIKSILAGPAAEPGPTVPTPLTWIDASTLAIGLTDGDQTTVTLVNTDNRSAPAAVGPTIEVEGSIADAAVRADGALVIASPEVGSNAVVGRAHDLDTGEEIAVFDLPAGTERIDYDPTGTFLLISTSEGLVSWSGGGRSVDVAEGYVGVAWATAEAIPSPPEDEISLETIDSDEIAAAGIDSAGGCSFYRNGVTGRTVFFSGIDGAFATIDGQPQVFQTDADQDLGPFSNDEFSATYRDVSERVSSSIESSERSATLVITAVDGAEETTVDGIIWCGV